MANNYRDVIKDVLRELDSTLLDNELEALSWIGLKGAQDSSGNFNPNRAWSNLSPAQKQAINSKLNSLRNNEPNDCE